MGQTEPEEAEYFTISWVKLIAISGIFTLIGMAVIGVGYWLGNESRMLEADGLEASAVVTGKSVTKRRGGSGTSATNEYSVRYQFKVGNERYRDRKIVSRSFYDSVESGETVPVKYLAADPTINEIESGRLRTSSRVAMGIGALIVLGGIGILFSPRKIRKPAPATGATNRMKYHEPL